MHDGGTRVDNLVVTNNIMGRGNYGWFGSGAGEGNPALQKFASSWSFSGNAIYSAPQSAYPSGNRFPSSLSSVGFVNASGGNYRLSSGSPLIGTGTNGTDPGANIDQVQSKTGNAR